MNSSANLHRQPGGAASEKGRTRTRARVVLHVAAVLQLAIGCGGTQPTRRDLIDLFPFARVGAEPGLVDIGSPGARRYLVSGWSNDEGNEKDGTFAWGLGTQSVVEFYLAEAHDLQLTVRCTPFEFPGSSPQVVTFALNGTAGPALALRPEQPEYRVVLPRAAAKVGWNRLALRYAHAQTPSAVMPSGDARRLAVAWDFLRFDGEIDRREEARIDVPRRELFIPAGACVSYDLNLPPGTVLAFDDIRFPPDASATLTVRLESDDRPDEVVARLDASSRTRSVILPARWSGIVRLSLEARAARPGGGVGLAHPALLLPRTPIIAAAQEPRARRPPNVIVFLVDTLRADRLGCYGHDGPTSPNLDAFARDAILFDDAVAESSWTRASVASLFTGLPARVHGVNGRADALPEQAVTVTELLHEAGYETVGFVANGNVAPVYGFDRGFDLFELLAGTIVPAPDGSVPPGLADRGEAPRSDKVNRRALGWLDQRRDPRPFFLYLHTADPHSPYTPPPEFRARLGAPEGPPDLGSIAMLERLKQRTLVGDDALVHGLLSLYDAEIAENDQRFGELIAELRRRDLYDGSLIVFLSDHGEEFHEHDGYEHGRTLYREVTKVPLLIKLPAGDGPGNVRIERTVQLADVVPTLIDHLGLRRPSGLGGASLLARLAAPDRAAFSHLDLDGLLGDGVVEGRWKVVRFGERVELYDRERDPLERTDVAPDRPVTSRYLTALLAEDAARGAPPLPARRAVMTDAVRANLRALGYVQ